MANPWEKLNAKSDGSLKAYIDDPKSNAGLKKICRNILANRGNALKNKLNEERNNARLESNSNAARKRD